MNPMTESIKPCIKCGTKPILIHSHTFAYWCCPNCGNQSEPYYNKDYTVNQILDFLRNGIEPFFYNNESFEIDFSWNWNNSPEEEKKDFCDLENIIILDSDEAENFFPLPEGEEYFEEDLTNETM